MSGGVSVVLRENETNGGDIFVCVGIVQHFLSSIYRTTHFSVVEISYNTCQVFFRECESLSLSVLG